MLVIVVVLAKLVANANVAFSKETLQHFAKLVELTKQPAQELAEKLFREAIEREEEDFSLIILWLLTSTMLIAWKK